MHNFNSFTGYLESCKKIGNFKILAVDADLNEWGDDTYYYRGKPHKYESYKDRKTESDRWVGEIWTFDKRSWSLSKKTLYRNTKGVYFKGLKYESNLYILKEPLPKNMK